MKKLSFILLAILVLGTLFSCNIETRKETIYGIVTKEKYIAQYLLNCSEWSAIVELRSGETIYVNKTCDSADKYDLKYDVGDEVEIIYTYTIKRNTGERTNYKSYSLAR